MDFSKLFERWQRRSVATGQKELGGREEDPGTILLQEMLVYGRDNDGRTIGPIGNLYEKVESLLSAEARLDILHAVIGQFHAGRVSCSALIPFILKDSSFRVVSSAALYAAEGWPSPDGDPLAGVRDLASHARLYIERGEEDRAAGILAGLVLLGDRRVTKHLGPCWRWLTPDARITLGGLRTVTASAALVDWLIDWLEECEGEEFGNVAGALAFMALNGKPPEVLEVRRALPFWTAGSPEQVLQASARWSFPQYAERHLHRMLQIAADESVPRIMHRVLKCWGVDHSRRHVAGVHMRPLVSCNNRPLLPVMPGSQRSTGSLVQGVPLEPEDFLSRNGQLILSWGIFNPYGPSWSCLGLLPTEDDLTDLLFYRMLNPFSQEAAVVAKVIGGDRSSPAVVGGILLELFRGNELPLVGHRSLFLLAGSSPEFVLTHGNWSFGHHMRSFWQSSPRLREFDLERCLKKIRTDFGQPWERTRKQRDQALAPPAAKGGGTVPAPMAMATPALIDEWLELILREDHYMPELICFPAAWHGAVDHAPDKLGQNAFTFWQLDDFLTRFGAPVFRLIAEAQDRTGPPKPYRED